MFNVIFEYYIHIKFNLDYSTCFHNNLEGALCKDILATCNIITIFNIKTWKTKLSLHLLWLLLLWLKPKCFNSYVSFYLLV
jgi:hypothetical protein